MPWAYVRQKVAERWHIPPWEVDDALEYRPGEVEEFLRITQIEAECEKAAKIYQQPGF